MSYTLSLINNEVVESTFCLIEKPANLNMEETLITAYQDGCYSFKLISTDPFDEMNDIVESISINNQDVSFKSRKLDSYNYLIEPGNTPFLLVYGVTDIAISIRVGEETVTVFSPLLAVAIKENYKEIMTSIHEMLNEIYLKEHRLLTRNAQSSKKNADRIGEVNKYSHEISVLKSIVKELNENYIHFLNSSNTKPQTIHKVDNFKKVRSIGHTTIRHILTNPAELRNTNTFTGISFGNENLLPLKTLVDTIYQSKETAENYAIIALLNTIEFSIREKVKKLETQLHCGIKQFSNDAKIKSGYTISFSIIEQYLEISFNEYLNDLKKIHEAILQLTIKYKKILPNNSSFLNTLPQPTTTFLEIHHYREAYHCMVNWFSMDDISIPSNEMVLHFHSADRIYEYYSLLNIIDILNNVGWVENISKRSCEKYNIEGYDKFLYNNCDNTFYFSKDKTEIVLYYQPVIFSSSKERNNGINLLCVESGKYYTPDFILKIVHNEKDSTTVKYGIIDAKWRNRESLGKKNNDGGFGECVFKYYCSVIGLTMERISFMWLLQGKDDASSKIYYHNSSSDLIKIDEDLFYAMGIVSLTPKTGIEHTWKILNRLIGS